MENLHHQFHNCWHRLHWASSPLPGQLLSQPFLLPGGGKTEASCIVLLEQTSSEAVKSVQLVEDKLPMYFTSQSALWACSEEPADTHQWKVLVYEAFSKGLRQLLGQIIANLRPDRGKFQIFCDVEGMINGRTDECKAVDVGVVKLEAWSRAVWLLEKIFMSNYIKKGYH